MGRSALRTMLGLLLAAATGATQAGECAVLAWDGQLPASAPTLAPGVEWTYSSGEGWPLTPLRLAKIDGNRAEYLVDGRYPYQENWASYADVNPLRKGEKTLLRFPFQVGEYWTDTFSEPGEYQGPFGHFLYRYEESATSTVQAVEDVTVAAGTFKTIRVGRITHWVKTQPQALDQQKRTVINKMRPVKAEGYVLTQMWYAPSLGRVVLKATLHIGDAFYAHAAEGVLNDNHRSVVELVSYRAGDTVCGGGKPLQARQPEMYFPLGYDVIPTDTWEWALRTSDHVPQRIASGHSPVQ